MPALVALLDVAAKRGGPTDGDVAQGAALPGRECAAVPIEEGIAVLSEDVGHFEPGTGHGLGLTPTEGSRRSSGLCVAPRAAAETWV